MAYSWYAKNYSPDFIYRTRLRLIRENNIKLNSPKMYAYYMAAHLGIILQ